MKNICLKISKVLKNIFGYSIMVTLFVGGLTFFGYLAALIIGGETAANICHFIYKDLFPILVIITTVMILVGLLAMYLSGEQALTASKKKDKEKADN